MKISMQRNLWGIVTFVVLIVLLSWQPVYAGKWIKATNTECWIWNPHPVPNESVTYMGNCLSRLANGRGILTWYQDGKKKGSYSGQFEEGKMHGYGSHAEFIDGKKKYVSSGQYRGQKRNGMFNDTWFKDEHNYITVKRKFQNGKSIGDIRVTTYKNGKRKLTHKVSEDEIYDILQDYTSVAEKQGDKGGDSPNSTSTDGHLTRNEAKKVFLDSGWRVIVASANKQNVDTGKLYNFLLEQGFIKTEQVLFNTEVKPTKKLLPYTMSGASIGISLFGMVTDVSSFWYGDITDVHVTGISPISKYRAIVELNAVLRLTEIGEILDNANRVAIVLKYQYYDDGWRIKDVLWDETRSGNNRKRVRIKGLYSTAKATNVVLNNMHVLGQYSDNFMELAGVLEQAGYYPFLKTAAWAYYDNGYRSEAVNLFRKRVLPVVMKKGTEIEIEEYKEEFRKLQSIKEDPDEDQNIVLYTTEEFRVVSCSFYENKNYKRSFAKSNARYIGVEVKFQNLQFAKKDHSHVVKRTYYNPKGHIMGSPEESLTIKKDKGWAYFSQGWGWKDSGHWKTGTYHVEIFIDGVKIARKAFSIDDTEDISWNKKYLKNIHNYKGLFEYNNQPIYNIDQSGRPFTDELSSEVLDPSRPVLVTGMCPFECCKLGPWTATVETPVYDRPEGDPISMLVRNESVFAISSLIKTFPRQATVNRVHKSDIDQGIKIGSSISILCPLGEGAMAVYHKGKLIEGSLDLDFRYDNNKYEPKQWVWWVKVILENGDNGWLEKPSLFRGMDSCSSN